MTLMKVLSDGCSPYLITISGSKMGNIYLLKQTSICFNTKTMRPSLACQQYPSFPEFIVTLLDYKHC